MVSSISSNHRLCKKDGRRVSAPLVVQNEAKLSLMRLLPSCAVVATWSQSLCSSDPVAEPQYRVCAHTPSRPNSEQGSAAKRDVAV